MLALGKHDRDPVAALQTLRQVVRRPLLREEP